MAASGEGCLDCLDNKLMRIEAEEAIKEVTYAVKDAHMSATLPCTEQLVYFNIVTKENRVYCIELSVQGYRVVGKGQDIIKADHFSAHFETIYSLLDTFSPEYQSSFGNALMKKLNKLEQLQRNVQADPK